MSVISRLILVQPDTHLRESLRFGFEREGVAVAACGPGDSFDPDLFAQPAELVVAGGRTGDEARAILSLVRGVLAAAPRRPPVLYVGNGIARSQALAEGATEFLGQPVFVRDAVTVAKLLAGRKRDNPSVLAGELGEHFGLFYLVRAISALGRRGVLTLVRGLRRGELRFFDGEVTSAQVGLLHGLAALHQLLLWTEGRFELRPEDVVRRQQIPLEPTELFADAERFLSEICSVAGVLSPSACYERDDEQIGRVAGRIPPEVTSVLNLFDGTRNVADVVEDCQYRVFETLRIANRLCELGLIRLRFAARPRHKPHAALAIEEWLIGDKTSRGAANRPGDAPAEPGRRSVRERRRRKRRKDGRNFIESPPPGLLPPSILTSRPGDEANAEAEPRERDRLVAGLVEAGADSLVVDWAQLLPDAVGDLGVSPVVPSSVAAGEISSGEDSPHAPEPVNSVESAIAGGKNGAGVRSASPSPADVAASVTASGIVVSSPLPSPLPPAGEISHPGEPMSLAREASVDVAPESLTMPAQPSSSSPSEPVAPTERRRATSQPPVRAREPSKPPFSASEEEFFARGHEQPPPPESFDDLDDGLDLPVSFWRRIFRGGAAPSDQARAAGKRGRRR